MVGRSSSLILAAVIPAARAHMALWHPSMYGFEQDVEPINPLFNMAHDNWWFHGNLKVKPTEVMAIPAGQPLTVEIACGKQYTSWGDHPSTDACPRDSGAYHAGGTSHNPVGWQDNDPALVLGCALAIAFKGDAKSVQPEDFTVMSIQPNCVMQRDTTFEIPANLPECPDGECTCAWFWQGKNSQDEMYLTGFRCNVEGGVVGGAIPVPAEPRKGAIKGPTQPAYWANDLNNIGYAANWGNKPSYNAAFGWPEGAQTEAFGAAVGGGGGGTNQSEPAPSPDPVPAPAPTSSLAPAPTITTSFAANNPDVMPEPSPSFNAVLQADAGDSGPAQQSSTGGRWGNGKWGGGNGKTTWFNHAAEVTGLAEGESQADIVSPPGAAKTGGCNSKRSRRRRAIGH